MRTREAKRERERASDRVSSGPRPLDSIEGQDSRNPIAKRIFNIYRFPFLGGEVQATSDLWHSCNFVDGATGEVVDLEANRMKNVGPSEWDMLSEEEKAADNVRRSASRRRNKVRRIARYNACRYMLTLTFPGEGVHDYQKAYTLFSRFVAKTGGNLLQGEYLAVPELHPGGHGWHWHLLTPRFVNVSVLRGLWTAWLDSQGLAASGGARFVQVEATDWGSPRRAAIYAAKYVGKDLTVPKGRQAYLVGQGLKVPESQTFTLHLTREEMVEEALAFVPDDAGDVQVWKSWEDENWEGPDTLRVEW